MKKNMYVQQTLEKYMRLPISHLKDGEKQEKLNLKKHQVGKDCIVSEMFINSSMEEKKQKKRKRKEFVMQELVVNIKKKTLKDKLISSRKNIQVMKLSKTLDQDLIGKEKDLKPFWTEYSKELSKKLWLATKTGCVDLDMKCLNKSVRNLIQNSWFSTKLKVKLIEQKNYQKIYYPLLQSSSQEIMDYVQERIKEKEKNKKLKRKKKKKKLNPKKEEKQLKVKKIRIYPTKEEKNKLRKWMGTARWTYNQCLNKINKKESKITKKDLRSLCLNRDSELFKDNLWLKDIPYDVRDEGMIDLIKAYKNNFEKGEKFKIKFRSKKDKQQSIVIHHKHYKHKKGNYGFIKDIKTAETLPEVKHDCRIILDQLNRYYICIPIELNIRPDNQRPKIDKIISIDPGVRSFATCYDPDGIISEWGIGDIGRIHRLSYHYDKLQSIKDKSKFKTKTKRNFKKKMLKIRDKIRNIVKDLHCKLSKYLCSNYNVILLPEFKSQGMVNKNKRKINNKTARAILTWSHYLFRQRLMNKSKEFPWVKVVIVTEEYTSKTCGNCGKLNQSLGSKKDFKCSCGYEADRDVNGARNILLKFISEKE